MKHKTEIVVQTIYSQLFDGWNHQFCTTECYLPDLIDLSDGFIDESWQKDR
ncbi:hypothetical protein [Chryseobacterium phosphatilyticum]|uniref:hypothetical protein n=1 Tax=Chryseobacterium phosphatilyticum TaxID=475075 RepID=UPI0014032DA8|nr:hypothetical protein [Chryseobacterium phosphatilyticum]